ncbi:MAG: nucleotidyltransferase family protein [Lachnospiraceae bacterium]|nr:nucleotidyltransferase family protein [Lachnospiraceae bacterium]
MNRDKVFGVIKNALWNTPVEVTPQEWPTVYKQLSVHGVLSLANGRMDDYELLQNVYDRWCNALGRQINRWYTIAEAGGELMQLLNSRGLDIAVLKGMAAAQYYPEPTLRVSSDVDIYVRPEDFDRTYHIMLEAGYELEYDENFVTYHYSLKKDGVVYELHKHPAGMRDNDKYLAEVFADAIGRTKVIECGGYSAQVFPDMENGLVLLLHIVKHFEGGLSLKQIVDWMMFVDKCLDDDSYAAGFGKLVVRAKLETVTKNVTRFCQKYLGLRDTITWCRDADEEAVDALAGYIMSRVDIVTKSSAGDWKTRAYKSRIKRVLSKPVWCMKKLQSGGMEHWEAAKKCALLRPFAWLYYTGYLIKNVFVNRKHVSEQMAIGRRDQKVVDMMKIYRK